jgi:ABC-type amino acid transport substrate-binding protein
MNRIRRQLLCAPLLAALPAIAGPARLRMVVLDLMPWAGHTAGNQLRGASVDLARQLSLLIGQPIVTSAVPYARAIAMLANGGADLMLAIDADPHSGLPAPLASVGTEEVIIVGQPGLAAARLDTLCGHQLALLRGASFDAMLRLHPCISRYETNSYEQGLRMLKQGRVDGVAGVRSTMDYAIRRLGLRPSEFGAALMIGQADISLYLAPKAATPALAGRLQQACAQLRHQKQMPALLAQYRQVD